MQQRVTSILVDYPVHVGSVADQKLRNSETNAGVLKADWLIGESVYDGRERGLIQGVWLIDLCFLQYKQSNNFVVAPHARHKQRSLSIINCLQVHVHFFVPEQKPANLLKPFIRWEVPKWAQ